MSGHCQPNNSSKGSGADAEPGKDMPSPYSTPGPSCSQSQLPPYKSSYANTAIEDFQFERPAHATQNGIPNQTQSPNKPDDVGVYSNPTDEYVFSGAAFEEFDSNGFELFLVDDENQPQDQVETNGGATSMDEEPEQPGPLVGVSVPADPLVYCPGPAEISQVANELNGSPSSSSSQGPTQAFQLQPQVVQKILAKFPKGAVELLELQLHVQHAQQALNFPILGTMEEFIQRLSAAQQVLRSLEQSCGFYFGSQFLQRSQVHPSDGVHNPTPPAPLASPAASEKSRGKGKQKCKEATSQEAPNSPAKRPKGAVHIPREERASCSHTPVPGQQNLQPQLMPQEQHLQPPPDDSPQEGCSLFTIQDKVGLLQTVFQAPEYVLKQDGNPVMRDGKQILRDDVEVTLQNFEENEAPNVMWQAQATFMGSRYPYMLQTRRSTKSFKFIRLKGSSLTRLYAIGVPCNLKVWKTKQYVLGTDSLVTTLEKKSDDEWGFHLDEERKSAMSKFMTFLFVTIVNDVPFGALWLKDHGTSEGARKSHPMKFLRLEFKNWKRNYPFEPAVQAGPSSGLPGQQVLFVASGSKGAVPTDPGSLFLKLQDTVTEPEWQSQIVKTIDAKSIRGWGRGCLIIQVEFPSPEAKVRFLDQIKDESFRLDGSRVRLATDAEASVFGLQDDEASSSSSDSESAEGDTEDDEVQESTTAEAAFRVEKVLLCHDAVSDGHAEHDGPPKPVALPLVVSTSLVANDSSRIAFGSSDATCTRILKALDGCRRSANDLARKIAASCCNDSSFIQSLKSRSSPSEIQLLESMIVKHRSVPMTPAPLDPTMSQSNLTNPETGQEVLQRALPAWEKIVVVSLGDGPTSSPGAFFVVPTRVQTADRFQVMLQVEVEVNTAGHQRVLDSSVDQILHTLNSPASWTRLILTAALTALSAQGMLKTQASRPGFYKPLLKLLNDVDESAIHSALTVICNVISTGQNAEIFSRCLQTRLFTLLMHRNRGIADRADAVIHNLLCFLDPRKFIEKAIETVNEDEALDEASRQSLVERILKFRVDPEPALPTMQQDTSNDDKSLDRFSTQSHVEQVSAMDAETEPALPTMQQDVLIEDRAFDRFSTQSHVQQVPAEGADAEPALPALQQDTLNEDKALDRFSTQSLVQQVSAEGAEAEPALPTVDEIVEYICTICQQESRGLFSDRGESSASYEGRRELTKAPTEKRSRSDLVSASIVKKPRVSISMPSSARQVLPRRQSENRSEVMGSAMVERTPAVPAIPSNAKDYEDFFVNELNSSTKKIQASFSRRWETFDSFRRGLSRHRISDDWISDNLRQDDHIKEEYERVHQVEKFLAFVLGPVLYSKLPDQSVPLSGSLSQIICDFLVNVWHDFDNLTPNPAVSSMVRFLELAPDMVDALFIIAAERSSSSSAARLFLDLVSKGEERLILLPKAKLFSFFVEHAFKSGSSVFEARAVVNLIRMGAVDPHSAAQTFETLYKDASLVATWTLPLLSAFSVLLCDSAHVCQVHPVLKLLISRPDETFLLYLTKIVKALDPFIQSGSDYEADLLLPLAPLLVSKYEFQLVFPLAENFTKYCKTTKLLIREQGFPYFVEHAFNSDTDDTKAVVTLSRHIAALDSNLAAYTFETLYKDAPPVAKWSMPLLSAFSVLLCDPAHICKVHPVLNSLNSHPDEKFVSYVTRIVKALSPFIESGSNYEADVLLPLAPLLVSEKEKFQLVLPLAENFSKFSKETKLLVRERGFPFFVQHVYDSPSQSYSDWNSTQREEAKDVVTLCRHIAALDPSFAPRSFETLYKDAPPVATWSLPLLSAFSVLLCDPAHVRQVHPVLNSLNSRSDERFLSYVTKVVKALDRYIQPGSDYEVDLLLPLAPLLASKYDFQVVLRLAKNFDNYPERTKLLLRDRGFLSLLLRSLDRTVYSLEAILPCILGLSRMSPDYPKNLKDIALQIWPKMDKKMSSSEKLVNLEMNTAPQERREVMEKMTSLLPKIFDSQDEHMALFLVSVLSTMAGLDESSVLSIEFWQCLGNLLSNSSNEVHDRTVAILAREFVEQGHVLFCFCLLESAFRAKVAGRLLKALAKADKQGRLASAFLEKAIVFLEERGPRLARSNKTMDLLVQCKTVDTMRRANTVDLLAHGKFAAAISGLFNALDPEPRPVKDAAAQLALLLLTSGELRQLDDGGADAVARQALSAWGYTLP